MSQPNASDRVVMPTPEMWELIIEFARARVDDQSLEQDLIAQRDKYQEDLNRMGDSEKIADTPEYKRTMVSWGRTLRAIKSCRPRIEYYGNAVSEAIDYGAQGRFWDAGKIEAMRAGAKEHARDKTYSDVETSAESLAEEYRRKEGQEKAAKDAAPKKGEPPAADAPWRSFGLFDTKVGLTGGDLEALKQVGLITVGHAYVFVHEENHKLSTVDGLSKKGAGALMELIGHCLKGTPGVVAALTPGGKPSAPAAAAAPLKPVKTDPSGKKKKPKGH